MRDRGKVADRLAKRRVDNLGYYAYELARKRASIRSGEERFELRPSDVVAPTHCPITGLRLVKDGSGASPILERIEPALGWIRENVWVVSKAGAEILRSERVWEGVGLSDTVPTPEDLLVWKEELARIGVRSEGKLRSYLGATGRSLGRT